MKKITIMAVLVLTIGIMAGCGKGETNNANQASAPVNSVTANNANNTNQNDANGNTNAALNLNLQEVDSLSNGVDAASKNADTEYDELVNIDTSGDDIEI